MDMDEILPEHPRFRRLMDAALPCYTLNHADPRGLMHVYLEVRSGSAHEREDQRGMAHLVEHAVFLGTRELLDADAVRAALAKIGASMGADSNAFTDYLQTVYTLRCACSGNSSEEEIAGEDGHSEEQRRQGMLDASQVGRIGGMLSTRERSRSWGAEGDMVVRRDTKDALRDSLELLHQFAFHATMPEPALEKEKSTVLSEMQMRNTCDYRAEEKFTSQVHPTCYLSQRFPIGLKEQIESWSREDIVQFYNEHYRADNMRLFVVGPIGPEDVEETVNSVFQGIPMDRRRSDPSRIKPLPCMCRHPDEPIRLHLDPLHTQVSVTVCSMMPLQPLRTLQDVRIMAMDSILQMGLDLRFEALIENDATHSIMGAGWDHVDSFREGCGILTFSATLSKEKWPQALQTVFQEIGSMHAYGLGKSEFKFCVDSIIREAEIDAEQNESQDSAHLIEDLLDSVCLDEAFMDDDQLCQLYKKVLPSITLEEINSRCQHLLSFVMHLSGLMETDLKWDRHDLAKPGSIFVSGPSSFPEGVETPEREAIFSMICAALNDPVRPLDLEMPDFLVPPKEVEETTLLARSYTHLSAKKDEVALDKTGTRHGLNPKKKCKLDLGYNTMPRVWDPHTRVTRMSLSNGMNLIYRQTDFDRSQVSITVMAWGGRALEDSSAPGSVSIGFQTLMEGGAGGFSADMIGRYAQRHGCEISGLPEAEKVWIRADASVSNGGLQRAFELLYLFVVRGSFDQKAFLRAKENYRRAYEAMQKDLGGMAASTINELISPDARFLQPSLLSIEQLSLEECRNAIKKQFNPSNMELVVVGDFDPDLLESLVLAYFGTMHENPELTSLPPTIDGNHWQNICFNDCPARRALVVPEEAKRCILYMAIPTCNRWGMWHSSFRSSLKGSVLGDENSTDRMQRRWLLSVLFEIINLKLFSVVREEMGLAYDISFTAKAYAVYFTHGLLMIQATPHPEKAEEVILAVHRCLKGIISNGITDKDIEEAVRPMVSYVSTSLRTNEFWLKSMQGLSLSFWPSSRELVCGALEFLPTINKSQLKELVHEVFPTKLISWECFAMGNLFEGVLP